MRLLKTTLASALLALPLSLLAAPPADCPMMGPKGGPGMGKNGPFASLNLTPEQRSEFRNIMRDSHQKRRAIIQSYLDKLPPADREAMTKALDDNRTKTHDQMRSTLKPDQQKTFADIEANLSKCRAMPKP